MTSTRAYQEQKAERDALWEKEFLKVWLPQALSTEEYAEAQQLSAVVLKELYANIWLRGPEADLWEARKTLLLRRLDQCADRKLPEVERVEFNRQVNTTFGMIAKHHLTMITGFRGRYHRAMLPTQYSVTSVYKVARHRYWTDPEVFALERNPDFTKQPYFPAVINGFIYETTLGRWLLTEMAVKSRHAARLHAMQEEFWVWMVATDKPEV